MKSIEDIAELYGTPSYIVKALLKREFFPGVIWEPAAGNGDIVTTLQACGYSEVRASDLYDWGFRPCVFEDFLTSSYTSDCLVTNCPFSLKDEFVVQAKRLVRHKIAVLMPLDFEYTRTFVENHLRDSDFPFKAIYAFAQGVGWLRRTDRSGRRKVGWFVFDKAYQGPIIRETILFRPNHMKNDEAKSARPADLAG